MPLQTEWSKDSTTRRSRVDIGGEGVLVASTCGPEGAEVGSVVSHQDFLEGKYQDVIRKVFGPEILSDMITGCEAIVASRLTG
jgi:hypothetical protein